MYCMIALLPHMLIPLSTLHLISLSPTLTVAWVVGEDLTILEADTTITVGFLIVRGDRSESTRAFAYTEGGSATPGELYMHGDELFG